jgi:hypothetical protein
MPASWSCGNAILGPGASRRSRARRQADYGTTTVLVTEADGFFELKADQGP